VAAEILPALANEGALEDSVVRALMFRLQAIPNKYSGVVFSGKPVTEVKKC